MLNRFCSLSKKTPPSLFLTDSIVLDGTPTKNKWKCMPFLNCISNFEGTFVKIYKIESPVTLFLFFLTNFSLFGIIWKMIFVTNFPFLTADSLIIPLLHHHNSQIVMKVFFVSVPLSSEWSPWKLRPLKTDNLDI